MATTTVFTCDVCKQSKDEKDLAKIEVKTEGIRIKGLSKFNPLKIDICKECLKKKGFLVEFDEKNAGQAALHNKETLEDKLNGILEDLGVSFVE